MPPLRNPELQESVTEPVETDAKSKRLEILYEGYYYDVTEFMDRHPGGSVIKFYTEEGQDGTEAIQQFHYRSMKQVSMILKSFKKRPATEKDFTIDPEKLKRHQALSDDYAKLFVELQKEGLFKPSPIHLALRIFHWVALGIIGCALQMSPNPWINKIGWFCFIFFMGQAGYLMHEGGHNSLTGNVKVDKFLESIFMGVGVGVPSQWWNKMHNKHHAMPQKMHHDIDLHTTPLLAFNSKVVKDPKEGNNFFIQNQTWLFLLIDNFIVHQIWRFYMTPRQIMKKPYLPDIIMVVLHWVIILNFFSLPVHIFMDWLASNFVFGNFTLGHSYLPIADHHTHWVEHALVHSADVEPSFLTDYWMGYLDFQIEHHLFPTMPQCKNYLIKDRVKALAKKHNLPYHCYSFREAWGLALKNLYKVSNELKGSN